MGIGTAAYAADVLAGVSEETYAEFMAGEIQDERHLADVVEIQRRWFNRITPPGFSWVQPMFPSVAPFDAAGFADSFLDGLLGEDRNSVAVYPLSLALDPNTRETLVRDAEGKLIAVLPSDGVSRAWPEDADPARVVLQLDLLPSEDVEPYLYVEGRIAESAASRIAKPSKTDGPATKSLGAGEFGFAGAHRLTNGQMRLTATNGTYVAEIYSYTVWHTSSVVVTVWTNEYDEVITSTNLVWDPVSPPYAGIESAWACQTTNLVLSGGVGTWDDADVSTNARVRFYAAAKRMDSDEDGLSDGMEIFLHRTDPGLADTDGDGIPDGAEIELGLDPLDPTDATEDPDGDGFSNLLEYQLGSPLDNPAWNGEQLVYRLMHANTNHSLRVEVADSENCGGTGLTQYVTASLSVPDLLDCGYFLDITVTGNVEDHMSQYDHVYVRAFEEKFYFGGDQNYVACSYVAKTGTLNHLVLPNSQITLIYDTVSYKHHVDGYAAITDATVTDVLKMDLSTNLWWFAGENPGGGYDIQATLTAVSLTTGNLKWDVTAGTSIVDLNNGGADADSITAADDNSVTVKSTEASSSMGDVTITLTYNGVAVCSYNLTVRKPGTPQLLIGFPTDAPWMLGYKTTYRFKVVDQFGADVPFDMPINESFGAWTSDLWYELWPDPTPTGTSTEPYLGIAHQFKDEYGASQLVPSSVYPSDPAAGEPVQNATQYYRAGSLNPGEGILIKQHTLQMYRGYSRQQ